jgi:transglutaminase-like putative cysteine protease
MDVFETSTTVDLERDADGRLWSMRTASQEGSRTTTETLTWTGAGYRRVIQVGDEAPQTKTFPMDRPVMTDAESFLGGRLRAGGLKPGQTLALRVLDGRRGEPYEEELRVVARERRAEAEGQVECLKVLQRDPASGRTTSLWLDADGALVRLVSDGGTVYRRVDRAAAEAMPVRPPQFSVTTPSFPPLERIFSAERARVLLQLQGDEERALPELPASPWSRVVKTSGSDAEGWVLELELKRYDVPEARAQLPLDAETRARFASDLEPTPLMPADHERLVAKAREVIGAETDARKAALALARYVHGSLAKQSPEVASTTALEILEQGMGDCSEHCVLFVALCRAAGIPARRCSGYVNVGSMWGAHAWAEIWVGAWIGADPTTGEVGNQARYVFFGYPDRPDSFPGVVSARAAGRMRFVTTEVQEAGGRVYDLRDRERWRVHDPQAGVYVHALAGLELRGVPEGWTVRLSGDASASIAGPDFQAYLRCSADQGYDLEQVGGGTGTWGGAPARVVQTSERSFIYAHSRRRLVHLTVIGGGAEALGALERVLAETLAPRLAPVPAAAPEPAPLRER